MHDRRVEGQALTFGNAGALFMRAMTWYDHKTESIWSQPWGQAIQGELQGTRLEHIPARLASWESWRSDHPNTMLMTTALDRAGSFAGRARQDIVYGVLVEDNAVAYDLSAAREHGVINDQLNGDPLLIWAQGYRVYAYVRQVEGRTLTFERAGDSLRDVQTGSTWDPALGRATAGPLEGSTLRAVPSISFFKWAWLDFYPDSEVRP